jgi:CDP-glucose 4,6-dehydratase
VGVSEAFWHGRRVLVTGHTGFKGSWLCLRLAGLGAEVAGFSDGVPTSPSLYETAGVEAVLTSIEGDVRELESVRRAFVEQRPEIVFHLAAQSLVRRSFANPVATYETNVLGTANALEAVRATESVRAVVVVTSDKVYAPTPGRRHREGDPLGGEDPYSSSKASAELVTDAYRSSFFAGADAPAVATARAGNVIGGGDWATDRLIPDTVAALVAGEPLELRYPNAVRPWQHVLDALEGYLLLAERLRHDRSAADGWNFGPEHTEARTVEWVVGRVAELWGAPLPIAAPAGPQPPEAASLELDPGRARSELGWRPRWDLERALRATAEWYRRHAAGESARDLTLEQIESFAAATEPAPLPS